VSGCFDRLCCDQDCEPRGAGSIENLAVRDGGLTPCEGQALRRAALIGADHDADGRRSSSLSGIKGVFRNRAATHSVIREAITFHRCEAENCPTNEANLGTSPS
jgi:hypothetical protein